MPFDGKFPHQLTGIRPINTEQFGEFVNLDSCVVNNSVHNKAIQTDKTNLSWLLPSQKPRQTALAADLRR